MNTAPLHELLNARHACIRIVTHEEPDALELACNVASELNLEPWLWSSTIGVRQGLLAQAEPIPNTLNAGAALAFLRSQVAAPTMCITLDLADHLSDPIAARATRELIEACRMSGRSRLVMIDHGENIPAVIASNSARLRLAMPDDAQIESILKRTLRGFNRELPVEVTISRRDLDAMVLNLRGLTPRQIEEIITATVAKDRKFNSDDIALIVKAKRAALQAAGVLEFVDAPTNLSDVGGLSRLKKWLAEREQGFSAEAKDYGIVPPRGVLLLGVQGAGKSLAAKAISTAWKRPLLRLDPGSLYDRYVGESERRLREALKQAEMMAPIILWVDEIEKGFASAASRSTDGGLSQRMFGTLLTWMQEHTSPVFLVATANDIEALPPELLRKGRFDEIFFVDLPNEDARGQILSVHLKKRKHDPSGFDLTELVRASGGYSGAEIEQAIVSALHGCFGRKKKLDTASIVAALENSPPLSVTMAEKIEALREWAKTRCVPADV